MHNYAMIQLIMLTLIWTPSYNLLVGKGSFCPGIPGVNRRTLADPWTTELTAY